ncbi:hypothetical protein GQ457_04G005450 [Hibiscus cannabinus]
MLCKEECEVFRPNATFSRNIWRDQFSPNGDLDLSQVFDSLTKEIDALKEKVKDMLMASAADPVEKVKFIDTLVRLGVSYHLEKDIENQLETIFKSHHNLFADNHLDINTVSIVFRVFRQHGFKMSCDVFNEFKDSDGKFKETLMNDARGMPEANLKLLANKSSPHLAKLITDALDQPLNKCPPRLAARNYLSFYEEEDTRNETLLQFAKLDFNRVQTLHKQEICQIARFWDDHKFSSELPYARERYVEAYTWVNSVFYEPRYTLWRIIFTKIVVLVSILDDSFDAYGTPQELQRLTDALKRWEIDALDELQDYTRVICKAVLDVFHEIDELALKEGISYSVPYAKDALIGLAENYQAEMMWCRDGYVPTFEKYMSVATKTSTYDLSLTIAFMGMGKIAGKEAFEWLRNEPEIMKALNVIGRLMDDIVSHKFEQLREHCPSSVECYMKQHDVSENATLKDFEKMLEDAWKDVNEECMRPTVVPRDLLIRHLNYARVTYLFYKHGDGYTHPDYLKHDIYTLFVDPIPI